MIQVLDRVFRRRLGEAAITYEEARNTAGHPDTDSRHRLAGRDDVQPEVLYFLANDESPLVRRTIAANASTPRQADRLLAEDVDDEVRCELARKIGRLAPRLNEAEKRHLQELTFEILDLLAHDLLPRVRQIVAEEIKHCASVPRRIVHDLARDVEIIVSAPVLEYSPLLKDEELLEIIASGTVQGAMRAISRRQGVSEPVADAIVARGEREAIAELLANGIAQIREETLDRIIGNAPKVKVWHRPLVERPELTVGAIRRIAKFVALKLLRVLEERRNLPAEAAKEVRRAVAKRIDQEGADGDMDAAASAEDAYAAGRLDDECLLEALGRGDRDFVTKALSLKSELPMSAVRRVLASNSAKSVTALAWAAGLSMRTAIQIQLRLAKIAASAVLNARDGIDYPLPPDDLKLHLELFTG